jgi:hypothetical protein
MGQDESICQLFLTGHAGDSAIVNIYMHMAVTGKSGRLARLSRQRNYEGELSADAQHLGTWIGCFADIIRQISS